MIACSYCGRDNDETRTHCRECGTGLPQPATREDPPPPMPTGDELPAPQQFHVAETQHLFPKSGAFTCPDWNGLKALIDRPGADENQRTLVDEIVCHWAALLKKDLGGSYRLALNRDLILLHSLEERAARWLATLGADAKAALRDLLGRVAWGGWCGRDLVIAFAEEDDYYTYIAAFYPEGEHPLSVGVQLRQGFPHVALLARELNEAGATLVHEFVHAAVGHLPLPRWLDEGLAMTLQKNLWQRVPSGPGEGDAAVFWGQVSGWTPPVMGRELAGRHHVLWNEQRIQAFWAGTSFGEPGEASELSYSLAEVLVHLLQARAGQNFGAFVAGAHYDDAGQAGAMDCLGLNLADLVGGFLGPGNWHPVRPAMVACWNEAQAQGRPET